VDRRKVELLGILEAGGIHEGEGLLFQTIWRNRQPQGVGRGEFEDGFTPGAIPPLSQTAWQSAVADQPSVAPSVHHRIHRSVQTLALPIAGIFLARLTSRAPLGSPRTVIINPGKAAATHRTPVTVVQEDTSPLCHGSKRGKLSNLNGDLSDARTYCHPGTRGRAWAFARGVRADQSSPRSGAGCPTRRGGLWVPSGDENGSDMTRFTGGELRMKSIAVRQGASKLEWKRVRFVR